MKTTTNYEEIPNDKKKIELMIDKVNEAIDKEFGKISILKYQIQFNITEYKTALQMKSYLDDKFSLRLAYTNNKPKLTYQNYYRELEKQKEKYQTFSQKHSGKLPLTIQFESIEELRKQVSSGIDDSHQKQQNLENQIFTKYQSQITTLSRELQKININKKITPQDKKRQTNITNKKIRQLEENMVKELQDIGKQYSINQISHNKLEPPTERNPNHDIIKRRMILMDNKKNIYQKKLTDTNKERVNIKPLLPSENSSNLPFFQNADEIIKYNKKALKAQTTIKDLEKKLNDKEKRIKDLITSKEILQAELSVIDNIDLMSSINASQDELNFIKNSLNDTILSAKIEKKMRKNLITTEMDTDDNFDLNQYSETTDSNIIAESISLLELLEQEGNDQEIIDELLQSLNILELDDVETEKTSELNKKFNEIDNSIRDILEDESDTEMPKLENL